jgi:hypothetical protein
METTMSDTSSAHAIVTWTKQRLDEMDAILASLEAKAGQIKSDTKLKADQLIADLEKQRTDFQAQAKAQVEEGEVALQASKAQLETQWNSFEEQVRTYFDTVGKEFAQQQTTFQDVAAAHAKAWRESADKLHEAAGKLAAEKRTSVDAAVVQMRSDAAEAETRLLKLKQAGGETWAAMSAALAQSRKAFDEANQKAWGALSRAGQSKA